MNSQLRWYYKNRTKVLLKQKEKRELERKVAGKRPHVETLKHNHEVKKMALDILERQKLGWSMPDNVDPEIMIKAGQLAKSLARQRESARKYRKKNRDRINERRRAYYQWSKEKEKLYRATEEEQQELNQQLEAMNLIDDDENDTWYKRE